MTSYNYCHNREFSANGSCRQYSRSVGGRWNARRESDGPNCRTWNCMADSSFTCVFE